MCKNENATTIKIRSDNHYNVHIVLLQCTIKLQILWNCGSSEVFIVFFGKVYTQEFTNKICHYLYKRYTKHNLLATFSYVPVVLICKTSHQRIPSLSSVQRSISPLTPGTKMLLPSASSFDGPAQLTVVRAKQVVEPVTWRKRHLRVWTALVKRKRRRREAYHESWPSSGIGLIGAPRSKTACSSCLSWLAPRGVRPTKECRLRKFIVYEILYPRLRSAD